MSIEGPRVEADTDLEDAPPPDLLDIGRPVDPKRRRAALAVGFVATVVVAGLLAWQFWPRPPGPLTPAELQGVYAGMVRSDGTNDAQQISGDRRLVAATTEPADCAPLLEFTQAGLVPGSVDGMATYWIEGGATAMTTHRFTDRATAVAAFRRYAAALPACNGREVKTLDARSTGTIADTPTGPALSDVEELGYRFVVGDFGTDDSQYVFRLILFNNTVTAVLRLISGTGTYSEIPEDRVAQSLTEQMKAVQDLRTS